MNKHLILITGKSTTGKSASLRNIKNPEKTLYLNTESNKSLPFTSKFSEQNIIDPMQIPEMIKGAEKSGDKCDTIIIDSITYMMDQYESIHVIPLTNTMNGWTNYAQFFKTLMQQHIANSTKNIIMTAHTLTTLNEIDGFMETHVPIKGALKNQGIESYFSVVVSSKKLRLVDLEKYSSKLLNITEEEKEVGFKYVFQTKLTKETVNERIRSPMDMWEVNETFIDNDIQILLERLKQYSK